MKKKYLTAISALFTLALLLSACSSLAPATPDAAAQQATVNAAVTQAVETLAAQMTGTALAQPTATATLEPTATATTAPTATVVIPTATRVIIPATAAPTMTATATSYACKLVSTSPVAGTKYNINDEYDAVWVVKNIGTLNWEIGSLDLKYISGTKMQKYADIFDVSTLVKPDDELTLIVDMNVPKDAGKYEATWKLVMGGTTLCTLPVSIEAVKPQS